MPTIKKPKVKVPDIPKVPDVSNIAQVPDMPKIPEMPDVLQVPHNLELDNAALAMPKLSDIGKINRPDITDLSNPFDFDEQKPMSVPIQQSGPAQMGFANERSGSLLLGEITDFSQPSEKNDEMTEGDQMKGYMQKKSPDFLKLWNNRYFVLENRMLKYFQNEEEFNNNLPPKGILNFEQVNVVSDFNEVTLRIDLRISGSQRVFQLKLKDENEFAEWKEHLTHAISKSNGKLNKLSMNAYKEDVAQTFKFWRFLRISEENFWGQAMTGDLLLCSNKKKLKKVTFEHYVDRVFIIIKLKIEGQD